MVDQNAIRGVSRRDDVTTIAKPPLILTFSVSSNSSGEYSDQNSRAPTARMICHFDTCGRASQRAGTDPTSASLGKEAPSICMGKGHVAPVACTR